MSVTYSIRPETPADAPLIAALHQDAFGPSEPIPALVQGLREMEGAFAFVSLVAEDQNAQVIGHVMLTHAWLDAPKSMVDVLVLSPLGVRSDVQRQGIGAALIAHAIKAAEALGAPLLFLEGNPAYYGPRGFETASALGFRAPSLRIPDRAFQVVKLSGYSDDMTGTLVYREPFWALDCVGLRKET